MEAKTKKKLHQKKRKEKKAHQKTKKVIRKQRRVGGAADLLGREMRTATIMINKNNAVFGVIENRLRRRYSMGGGGGLKYYKGQSSEIHFEVEL